MQKKTLLILCSAAFSMILLSSTLQGTVATCPNQDDCEMWEPFEWQFGTASGDAIEDRITGAKDQGYSVTRWQDTAKDTSFGWCTRSVWNCLASGCGILSMDAHGDSGNVVAACNTNGDKILDQTAPITSSWTDPNGSGTPDPGMSRYYDTGYAAYGALITAARLGSDQSDLTDNEAIVHLATCHSADGAGSPLAACHGRTGFGYTEGCDTTDIAHNMSLLFDLMNGSKPTTAKGTKRMAGDAFTYGVEEDEWRDGFDMSGSHYTTLCPSVVAWDPDDGTGSSSGTGYVEFDTHCDNSVDPNDILSANVTSGSVNIGRFRWAVEDSETLDYKLKFKWCEGSSYNVTIKVEATELVGKDCSQELDGGNSSEEGVAPNGDDFSFSFSH